MSKWFDSTGLPDNSIGEPGDYFLHIGPCDIYKKNDQNWLRVGNIQGKEGRAGLPGAPGRDGLPGEDGTRGSMWFDGIGEPMETLGIINDYYLEIEKKDIYKKRTDGNWGRIGNISNGDQITETSIKIGFWSIRQDVDGNLNFLYQGE